MKNLGDFLMFKVLPVIAVILLIFVMILIGLLTCNYINTSKEREQAKAIFYRCNETYYIDTYHYSGDDIIAIDVNGHQVIFPKSDTVIEKRGE